MLTYNEAEDASKVWTVPFNDLNLKTQLSTEYFAESDISYNYDDKYHINALAVYKDRLYAGCDGGLVIVFTSCMKCYRLKKPVSIDIKSMTIEDDVMYVSDGVNDAEITMSSIGGDSIETDEARNLSENGGVLIDVRTAEEYAADHAEDTVNIPLTELETALNAYAEDTPLIFFCSAGGRAAAACDTAKRLGYTNVYNLGSYEKLK